MSALLNRRIALVGNPNCGKTALFNLLTGGRQKVANYAGVTVERKEGRFVAADGRVLKILDLPGTYSFDATSPDERIDRTAAARPSRPPGAWPLHGQNPGFAASAPRCVHRPAGTVRCCRPGRNCRHTRPAGPV